MKRLTKLEEEIQALSPEEAAAFRAWFLEFDWGQWDRQIQRDVEAGKLDELADEALRDLDAGRTTEL